jgi:exonuclease SbcD
MKIMHTGDWHMNSHLGRRDLTPHIVASLERIAGYLDEHGVDVLLVAGDLFSERSRDEGMMRALSELRRVFGPFVARGGTIIAIAGNHDSETRFETLRHSLLLNSGNAHGRFILGADPGFISLPDPLAERVQFVLLPFPTPRRYGTEGETANYSSFEERNRALQSEFARRLELIRAECVLPQFPTVLVSHIHVRGAQSHSLFGVSEAEDVVFEPSQIPREWAYGAYGHIHKPGAAIAGAEHIRYCGSPIALDAAERFDSKSCVLFELDASGMRGDIALLPLGGPRIAQIELDATIEAPEAFIARIAEQHRDDLVHYTLKFDPQTHSFAALKSAIERAIPGFYGFAVEEVGTEISSGPISLSAGEGEAVTALSGDARANVREFLSRRLQLHADKDAIVAQAEELMAESPA